MSTGTGGAGSAPPQGLDPAIAQQISLQILTGAINNQQLNAIQARNMVAASAAVLTMGVQLQQLAFLKKLTSISPLMAASAANLASSSLTQQLAGLQAMHRAP